MPHIDAQSKFIRNAFHKIQEQLKAESISMPPDQVLSEAQFCSNALLSHAGYSPYQAVYGRTPNMLPEIRTPEALNEGTLELPGTIRFTYRLREIAVRAIVDQTAYDRAQRASLARTSTAGERLEYKVGDQVDFFRPSGSKDISG